MPGASFSSREKCGEIMLDPIKTFSISNQGENVDLILLGKHQVYPNKCHIYCGKIDQ